MNLVERLLTGWGAARGAQRASFDEVRWVVADCESSGLDPRSDRLLSIGAVAVRAGRVVLDEAFSVVLRQTQASGHDNILIHGIDATAQLEGKTPAAALEEFSHFAGEDALAGFHTPFDAQLLERAFRENALPRWRRPWLDLAQLAPALHPELARGRTALDEWLDAFGIEHEARHDALADAYATAQLLLALMGAARSQHLSRIKDLHDVAAGGRWLAR